MTQNAITIATGNTTFATSPIEPNWIVDGEPQARRVDVFVSHDKFSRTILWECTSGEFDWFYDHEETVYILDGAVVLRDGSSPPRRLGRGDMVLFPAGAKVRWQIDDFVRKLAFLRVAPPKPIILATRALGRMKGVLRRSGGKAL
jgi:uncharacterized cupin superfamily protein